MNNQLEKQYYEKLMKNYHQMINYKKLINKILEEKQTHKRAIILLRLINPEKEEDISYYNADFTLYLPDYQMNGEDGSHVFDWVREESKSLESKEQTILFNDVNQFLRTNKIERKSTYLSVDGITDIGDNVFKPFLEEIVSQKEILKISNELGDPNYTYPIESKNFLNAKIMDEEGNLIYLPSDDFGYVPLLLDLNQRSVIQDYNLMRFAKKMGLPVSDNMEAYGNHSNTESYIESLLQKEDDRRTESETEFILKYVKSKRSK